MEQLDTSHHCDCDVQTHEEIRHTDGRVEWRCMECGRGTYMGVATMGGDHVFAHHLPVRESRWRSFCIWFMAPIVDETELDRACREEDVRRTKQAVTFFIVFALTLAAVFLIFAAVCP